MAFDKEIPEDNLLISLIPTNFRYILDFLEDMNNKEHVALAGGISELTAGGEHKEGSARCYVEDDEAAIEALVPLDTFEEGRIALAEDTGRMYIHDGTDWIDILDSFLSVAQTFADDLTVAGDFNVTGDFTVATNKFIVNSTSGEITASGKITNVTDPEDDQDAATKASVVATITSQCGQQSQVVGTDDITNTTGDYADMKDMSVTITTKGGNVLLLFSAPINLANDYVNFRFDMDSVSKGGFYAHSYYGARIQITGQWLETELEAGEHTFKVQWKDTAGTAKQNGATVAPRVFTVIEFPF